jgi:hypothetical protein
MWCWRRIEQISSWTELMRNEEVLQGVKEKSNTLLQTIKRKDNWFGHILGTIYLLKHVTEAKIEGRV